METPLECAKTIAKFIRRKFEEYEEKEPTTGKKYLVHVGFLPFVDKAEEKKKLCPAIAIRPLLIEDREDFTLARLSIYVTVFDEDMKQGCESLYHVLQFLRFHLLTNNPIAERFQIRIKGNDTMETFVPDEQPWPMWWGRLDFAAYLEQPSVSRIKKRNEWGR